MSRTLFVVTIAAIAAASWAPARAEEKLDRGVAALRNEDGQVYVGWRLLADDPPDAAFNVYRQAGAGGAAERITSGPVRDSTNFVDTKTPKEGDLRYAVRLVTGGAEGPPSPASAVADTPPGASYLRLKLQGPYTAQKTAAADLDGDGRLEIILKQPDFNTDPYQKEGYWKKSEDTYKIEAWTLDGRMLWRHDMGWSIEEGIWYSPYVVCDLDGDGRAEVYAKGGDGDPREPTGHVMKGDEWLLKLDGRTGRVLKKIPWIPRLPQIGEYNHYCRNLLAVAYLDGKRPHLIMQRGTYQGIVVEAYVGDLERVWQWKSWDEKEKYNSQGSHTLHCADVDGDGRDEIIVGSCVVDDNGKGLWTLGIGHPDTCYVGDIDPSRPGLEIFFGIEPRQKSGAVRLVEAATGKTIWANTEPTVHVHSQGMCADILAEHPGQECYAGEAKGGTQFWMYTADGKCIGRENIGGLAPWTLWWDDDPQKEIILGGKITKFKGKALLDLAEARRGTLAADILGDWREELVTFTRGEMRIYTTTIPARTRRVCLMQDRLYRNDVAVQSMGYNAPPQHSKPW
ncbi:MAG: silent information regulator protein Sir2 [Planctomycetes bacterium]|nr:silent information regulator protein Sir2 [Planctomycetota bacterium]